MMIKELQDHLKSLEDCCLQHPQDYQWKDIEFVEAFFPAPNDDHGAALFRMNNGMWGVLNEWQDYTGHG